MSKLRTEYSSTSETGYRFQHALDEQAVVAVGTRNGRRLDDCGGPAEHGGTAHDVTFSGSRSRSVAAVAPGVARMPSLDSDPQLKVAVSHAARQRTGSDSQTGLQCSWLDVLFHIPGTGLQKAQSFVKLEAVIAPAAVGSHGRQNVDWVRLGLAKGPFVQQLVAPLAAWAWDGSRTALDMCRFNFGPEQGSLVWFDAALGGSSGAVAVDHFRKTDGGEGPPMDLASAMAQVSEGGKAAVRANVRLSVSLSALVGGGGGSGKHQGQHSGDGADGTMSPRKQASAATGSCRPVFTVASVYISGLAPAKLKEPTFASGPLLHGTIECAAIAAVGGTRAAKPVAFGNHMPKGGSTRIQFASPITTTLEPQSDKKVANPRGFGSSAATRR